MKQLMITVMLLLLATAAQAQTTYPGSVWSTNGTVSPVEKNNFISMTHVEQGIKNSGAELFGQATFQTDSQGLDWNRRIIQGVGARYTEAIKGGLVRVGLSYLSEKRFVYPNRISGFAFTIDMWAGWDIKKH